MKPGDKKTFVYMPLLGFVEAADTIAETMSRINRAEVKKENEDKKTLRLLQRKHPGEYIIHYGDNWYIS